jgi:hypothetical protein
MFLLRSLMFVQLNETKPDSFMCEGVVNEISPAFNPIDDKERDALSGIGVNGRSV